MPQLFRAKILPLKSVVYSPEEGDHVIEDGRNSKAERLTFTEGYILCQKMVAIYVLLCLASFEALAS